MLYITIYNNRIIKTFQKTIFTILKLITIFIFYLKIDTIYSMPYAYITSLNCKIYHHHGNEIIIKIYNIFGNLTLQLIANDIQYRTNPKNIRLIYPQIIIFNDNNSTTIWKISCNQAELNHEHILKLSGYVFMNKIMNNTHTQSIITNQVLINLINQNMVSYNTTIIHGRYFYSIGSSMYTELKTHQTQLTGKIYTQYEIKYM